MWSLLTTIKQKLVWSIPIAMVVGIGFGAWVDAGFLRVLIIPLTFLMVYPMMVNLQLNRLLSRDSTRVQLMAQLINFIVIPFFAFGIGKLFYSDQPLILLGLLLTSLLPTSGMTISWTGFARGNLNAAVQMTVVGLILGSIATPFYAKWLMGAVIEIPLAQIFRQIAIIVFLPMILGWLTRKLLIITLGKQEYHQNLKFKFPSLSTLGVIGIVFVAMALRANTILAQPLQVLTYFLPLLILYSFNFMLSTAVGRALFKREDAIALVYGTVMRNLSIALALAMMVFQEKGSEIALIISMAYIIQVQSAAWFVRFTDRVFGLPLAPSQEPAPRS